LRGGRWLRGEICSATVMILVSWGEKKRKNSGEGTEKKIYPCTH
jgi:hypothetical protein